MIETASRGVRFSLPSQEASVSIARSRVGTSMGDLGCSQALVVDGVIAVSEAVSNVVRHAYPGRTDGEVHVEVRSNQSAVLIVVNDDGCGPRPNPLSAGHPSLGFPMMASLTDRLCIEGNGEIGTSVMLTFLRA